MRETTDFIKLDTWRRVRTTLTLVNFLLAIGTVHYLLWIAWRIIGMLL
jgi:hypothetical protein